MILQSIRWFFSLSKTTLAKLNFTLNTVDVDCRLFNQTKFIINQFIFDRNRIKSKYIPHSLYYSLPDEQTHDLQFLIYSEYR